MSLFPPSDPNSYGQAAQAFSVRRPGVVAWFKLYLAILIALGIVFALSGLAMVGNPVLALQEIQKSGQSGPGMPTSVDQVQTIGWVYGVVGMIAVVLPLAWFLLPRSGPAKWGLGVVVICVGMTTVVLLPLLIPLLIFWVREDCKAWCRGGAASVGMPEIGVSSSGREPWD